MKIAIVTGASSGIGREFVKLIDQHYSNLDEIWVISRRQKALEQLQRKIRKPLRILPYDLSKREQLSQLKALIDKKHPQIVMLVGSAGMGIHGTYTKIPYEDQLNMIDVNVRALTAVTAMAMPYMCKNSHVVLIASAAAFMPNLGFGIYAATKAYVLSYARSLHHEAHKRKIAVTAVCPGPVATEFFDIAYPGTGLPRFKRLFLADCVKVSRQAFNKALNGKEVVVYGWSMKALRLATHILPKGLILRGMRLLL